MTMRSDATKLKLLLLSDLEGQIPRVNQLCEELVSSEDCDVNVVLVTGGLVAKRGSHDYEALETVAAAEGDMMALISRLEMIICRVLYIPDDNDPPTTRSIAVPAPSLTQYSSNVYYQEEQLIEGVTIMGEARYFKLVNDGKDPMQDRDMVLVLRDSSVKTRLPVVESSFFAGLLPMLQSNKPEEPRAIEIIGGSDQHPHAQLPLIYPGSLRLGQYTILQLEKDPLDDKWCIAASENMGTGTYDSYWGKPRDTPSLRELEQLRVLAMYEFEPPLSSQELVGALRACSNRSEHAYQYLKASRRHQRSIVIPASAPAATINTSMATPEREKRRLSASSGDKGTPSKRHKDLSFSQMDTEEKTEEEEEQHDKETTPDTQQDEEMLHTAADCARAQQLLLETVEDRVAGTQPLRNPDWVNQVWASLQVPAVLELAMHLNLTVDALATWVKDVETQYAKDIQTRGAALVVEVAASLPPYTANANDSVAFLPKDEVLAKHDNEVAAIAQAESQAAEPSAYARANAAKSAIESLSSACKAYMDRLAWFAQSGDKNGKETADVGKVLETLGQKLEGLVDICTHDVKEAESTLLEAKQKKGTRSLQIVEFVNKQRQELLDKGETEACATLDSVVGVWKKDDVEVQALWSSRSQCERQMEESARALNVAEHALAFHKNLHILFRKVRERREEALTSSSKGLEEARATSEARATASLEGYIPMLTRALCRYYDFHSVQQSKAKEELQEQEKALAAHNEYFGDSAPIKKGDIEQRIREFIGVTQSSMQVIMEIADGQQQVWEDKQAVLPESVRLMLLREFKALWMQLSGPMKDVMKKFVATIEESAGGAVAVQIQEEQRPQPDPAVPVFVATNALDEQVIPAFTVPVFTHSHVEAISPYRTAISAIVAPKVITNFSSQREEKGRDVAPTNVMPTGNSETRVVSALPQAPEPRKSRHEFEVGSILYSKITVGENCTQFVRGVVLKQLDNRMYLMQYDNGDKFSVGSSFLFTKELMEESLKAGGVAAPDQDAEMEDVDCAEQSNEGGCAIMYDESAAGDAWEEKFEQLQNELALAQYEAQKWKEKYLVEKRRRQKTARDLLDLVVRTERQPNGDNDLTSAAAVERSSLSPDHTANLLSPTLSSFDFDDDSSEDGSDTSDDHAPGTPLPLVEATRNESEVVAESEDGKPEPPSDRNDPFNPSMALELRDRQSLMHHLNATAGTPRVNRSSTTGSSLEAYGGSSRRLMDGKNGTGSEHSQQQHLMYRIMYAKPSSRDLWHARTHPNKLQNVARSIMFSMHLKKEHIFERFFVTGMALSETERQHQPSGLAGFWKPKLLYDFPNRINDPPDASIADFCFPKGVPLTMCTPEQAESILGVPVPRCNNWYLIGDWSSEEPSWKLDTELVCKFPFYRFHFAVLRMIIENELEQHRLSSAASVDDSGNEATEDEQFEIILRPLLDLAIEFTIYHEENSSIREHTTDSDTGEQSNMNSIATKLHISPVERRAVLSEDAAIKGEVSQPSTEPRRRPSQLRKSLSTDDIGNYNLANGWIMDKPMVKSIDSSQPKEYERVNVGDILEAVDSIATDKVVEIMAYLLLEKQVVIMSDNPAKISAVCTALLLLLAPFQWQSTYIPLLPSGLLDFLHSPVPFLVGCHSLSETSEWSDVCFYDIDRDRIAVPAVTRHLGPSSIPNGVELCRLLRKARERYRALRPTGKPWYELSEEQDTIITLTMQEAEIFLRDMGFDISSHDLVASISGGQSFYDRLQEEVAKEVRNSIYEDYLDEFTQTQLFCQYYESLLQPEAQKGQK
ncbi:hypothetical protein JG687_00000382 [Phytophthora cactorum]|uniref:UDENN domain-containing protein n=1 Tax=Phytophthora cactorum TaxID=29920 RepID=A0A8T1V2Z1_9STRA|nr:hypothetical protein JG687_00000382 [Phytophthora cactorum]